MSLAKTLIKVAIGVAVAKGVSTLVKGSQGGSGGSASGKPGGIEDIMDGIGGSRRAPEPQAQQGGGLEDLLGQLTGQGSTTRRPPRQNAPKGGLEDLLGGGNAQGGGFGDLLGQLTGQGSASGSTRSQPQSGGGLGDLLGQLTGASGGGAASTGGGLGDLLGQLTGASTAGRASTGGGGGLGDLLGQLTGGGAVQGGTSGGGGLGDLLGAVLGGVGGAAAGGAAPSQRNEDLAAALIMRAMIQAVKADGEFDADERAKLMKHAEGASREEIAFINAEMEHRSTVEQLAGQVPEGMEAQVYVMSLMAIDLDNQKEAKYLHSLAQALSLEPREVNALHDRAGVQRLYS